MCKKRILLGVLPLLLFIAVACVWFFPVLQHFSTSVAGIGGDPYQTLWRFNRLGETVKQGSIFVSDEKTLPNLAPLPWLPVYYLFGDVVAYNTAWITSVILAGYLGYVLARAGGAQFWPALVAGLLIELAPYRIAQSLGHFGAMQFWSLLAVLVCLTVWYQKNNLWYFFLGMVFSIWTAWTDHQLFVILMLIIAVIALVYWKEIVRIRKKIPVFATIFFVTILIAVLPFFGSIIHVSKSDGNFNLGDTQRETYSATLRSLLLPAPFSLIGAKVYSANLATDNVQTIGFVLPVIALVAFLVTIKKKKDLLFVILILSGIILSLGATLRVKGFDLWLPGEFIFRLPVLSAIRTVGRFVVLPVIFLPIYFAIKWNVKKNIYLFPLIALCLVEIIPITGFPVMAIDHVVSKEVASYLENGAILAIPAYTNYRYGSEQLYYSLDYKKSVVGNSALLRIIDPKSLEVFLATPIIRDLVLLRLSDFDLPTIFGQQNKDIVNLAFTSQGITNVIFETNPQGGVVSLEGNKQTILDQTQVVKVQTYLRDILGLRENKVGESTFVYSISGNKSTDAHYYVMEGRGWQIKKKTADRSVIELQKSAQFYVYASEKGVINLNMNVIDVASNNHLVLRSEKGERNISLVDGQKINMELETEAGKLIKYTIELDRNPILVENPRIQ
jgi:hypothetical protein